MLKLESAAKSMVHDIGGPYYKIAVHLLAPPLMLLAPLVNFVTYHQYSYFEPEILWLLVIVSAAGLVIGLTLVVGGQIVRVLIIGALLSLSLESLFEVLGLKLLVPVTLIVAWILRAHITEVVSTVFLVLILSTILLPIGGQAATGKVHTKDDIKARQDLPPIIHLILDEHIGIEGIPVEISHGAAIKEELKSFYLDRGFRLYGAAFSQYVDTYNSIPNALNFTSHSLDSSYVGIGGEPYILKQNTYFNLLSERGYIFRVYQSDYMDFCQVSEAEIATCLTYPSNSIKSIEDLPLASSEKARLIFHSFLSSSYRARWTRERYTRVRAVLKQHGWTLPAWYTGSNRVGPIPVISVIERLRADIAANPTGTVFFAHLNIPHYPYAYDQACQVRNRVSDWLMLTNSSEDGRFNTPATRALRYTRYFEQIQCQQKLLAELFDTLQGTGTYESATIIVHGDHGSRIAQDYPILRNRNRISNQDLIDGFSTLFAVKAPHIRVGYDAVMLPVQNLLADVVGDDEVSIATGSVFLRGKTHSHMLSYSIRIIDRSL